MTATIIKRDGSRQPFDKNKIVSAVTRCFAGGLKVPDRTAATIARHIAEAVANVQMRNGASELGVEDVQRLVIQQLWATGHFEAAEHYQNYREERRRARLAHVVTPEVEARVRADQAHFPTDLQYYQFIAKFSRWREEDQRRETWKETVYERVMPWLFRRPDVVGRLSEGERSELADAVYGLKVSPAMRVVQMAGPALDRCNVGAYNCAASPISDLFAFPEMLYILMQGTGHGFSVENDYVSDLPRIKKQRGDKPETIVVEDSTEGWCDAYHRALQLWWDGYDVVPDVSGVRPANARLKIKGGRASGPGPFLELISFVRNVVMAKQGRRLDDTDCHRIACYTGRIVQVGGVRRAAAISVSDLHSTGMRDIKSGTWYADKTYWSDGKYLTMANNSAVYEERPSMDEFLAEWCALVKSKSGERGIFNRSACNNYKPERRAPARFQPNPCAEISLRPYQFCNLSIAVARPDDTVETLERKVRQAAVLGTMQATCADFKYIRPEWKKNCEDERLMGVDITGHADCPLLRYNAPGRAELLRHLAKVVYDTNVEYARRFGINQSAANTTVKPGGDSGVFFDCASGVSPRFSDFQTRWVREPKDSPVARFLIDSGVPHAPSPEAPAELLVFGFPKGAPPGSTKRNDLTAAEQFHNWLEWSDNWAEHSVSATIYVEDHEWLELGHLVYKHFDKIKGLSFLPKDNGTYTYAPNEELSEAQYNDMVAKFPSLNWSKLHRYEDGDFTRQLSEPACGAGGCEL